MLARSATRKAFETLFWEICARTAPSVSLTLFLLTAANVWAKDCQCLVAQAGVLAALRPPLSLSLYQLKPMCGYVPYSANVWRIRRYGTIRCWQQESSSCYLFRYLKHVMVQQRLKLKDIHGQGVGTNGCLHGTGVWIQKGDTVGSVIHNIDKLHTKSYTIAKICSRALV